MKLISSESEGAYREDVYQLEHCQIVQLFYRSELSREIHYYGAWRVSFSYHSAGDLWSIISPSWTVFFHNNEVSSIKFEGE